MCGTGKTKSIAHCLFHPVRLAATGFGLGSTNINFKETFDDHE
jgi:hypothetical protein